MSDLTHLCVYLYIFGYFAILDVMNRNKSEWSTIWPQVLKKRWDSTFVLFGFYGLATHGFVVMDMVFLYVLFSWHQINPSFA